MIISLKEFCLTGQFGDVRPGMLIADVINKLGKPDHQEVFNEESGGIMYGWYEFFYWVESGLLYGIQNDHLKTWPGATRKQKAKDHKKSITFKNKKFEIDTWFLKVGEDLTYKEVVLTLKKENIEFKELVDDLSGPAIEFESGVAFSFDDLSGCFFQDANGQLVANENIIVDKNDQLLCAITLYKY